MTPNSISTLLSPIVIIYDSMLLQLQTVMAATLRERLKAAMASGPSNVPGPGQGEEKLFEREYKLLQADEKNDQMVRNYQIHI